MGERARLFITGVTFRWFHCARAGTYGLEKFVSSDSEIFFDVHTLATGRGSHSRLWGSLVLDLAVAVFPPCRAPGLLVHQSLAVTVTEKEFLLSRPSPLLDQSFLPPSLAGHVQALVQEVDRRNPRSLHNHL